MAAARERKKTDFRKGLHAGQQVSDIHQHKNRPAVLISLQLGYLLKGHNKRLPALNQYTSNIK